MATRAIVGMQTSKGQFLSVYTHWDGYPSHHLNILVNHYNTEETVKELLSHGDISVLDTQCDGTPSHSFDAPSENQTVYYGRDRGVKNTGAKVHYSLRHFNNEQYGYCFKDGEWYMVKGKELVHHTNFLKDGKYQDSRLD